jgi:hypothetical protein
MFSYARILVNSYDVKILVGTATGFGAIDGAGASVGVIVRGASGFTEGLGVGFAAALTTTPLLHTRRFPDFAQVNFFPPEIVVDPAFEHFVPAFVPAAFSGAAKRPKRSIKTITYEERFFTM